MRYLRFMGKFVDINFIIEITFLEYFPNAYWHTGIPLSIYGLKYASLLVIKIILLGPKVSEQDNVISKCYSSI